MRIRLALQPPFPQSKVLLPVPEEVKTISQLKTHIVRSLSAVAALAKHGRELALDVDGFELLGGSEVGVLEGGDVVTVRLAPGSSKTAAVPQIKAEGKKRRATSTPTASRSIKKPKLANGHATGERKVAPPSPHLIPRQATSQRPSAIEQSPPSRRRRSRSSSSSESEDNSSSSSSSASSESSSSVSESSSVTDTSSSASSESSSASSSAPGAGASEENAPTKPKGSGLGDNGHLPSAPPARSPSSTQYVSRPSGPILPINRKSGSPLTSRPPPPPPAPPGQGKAETKQRNARRRKAREMKKLAEDGAPGAAASLATAIPRGMLQPADKQGKGAKGLPEGQPRAPSPLIQSFTTQATPALPVPSEMANRNKRKGFLREMAGVRGTRTVFVEGGEHGGYEPGTGLDPSAGGGDNCQVAGSQGEHMEAPLPGDAQVRPTGARAGADEGFSASLDVQGEDPDTIGLATPPTSTPRGAAKAAVSAPMSTPRSGHRRLVPPSERTDLPSNVFVTSMEYEWRRPKAGRVSNGGTRTWQQRFGAQENEEDSEDVADDEEGEIWERGDGGQWLGQRGGLREADKTGSKGADGRGGHADEVEQLFLRAEKEFDSLRSLTPDHVLALEAGSMIAWKELELDMRTFSPALVLHLARVLERKNEGFLHLERIVRPGATDEGDEGGEVEGLAMYGAEPADSAEGPLVLTTEDIAVGQGKWRVFMP